MFCKISESVVFDHTEIRHKWYTGRWFGTCFIFHNIWYNPSHLLIFFKMVKPTNQYIYMCKMYWHLIVHNALTQLQLIANRSLGRLLILREKNGESRPESSRIDIFVGWFWCGLLWIWRKCVCFWYYQNQSKHVPHIMFLTFVYMSCISCGFWLFPIYGFVWKYGDINP